MLQPAKQRGNCNKKVTRARPKRLYVRKTAEELDVLGPKKVPSRELRGGVLYTDCDCNRRNGLQHDCPRDRCAGKYYPVMTSFSCSLDRSKLNLNLYTQVMKNVSRSHGLRANYLATTGTSSPSMTSCGTGRPIRLDACHLVMTSRANMSTPKIKISPDFFFDLLYFFSL